jgi:hypothetical protein
VSKRGRDKNRETAEQEDPAAVPVAQRAEQRAEEDADFASAYDRFVSDE